jgi:adenosylmethionine-8-amino-7-oxononanoate aminotransferase
LKVSVDNAIRCHQAAADMTTHKTTSPYSSGSSDSNGRAASSAARPGHPDSLEAGRDDESSWEARDRRYVWHPFTQMAEWQPLVITEGDGCYLIDAQGRRYLDGVSSLWANVHGHRRREIDAAVRAQLDRIAHSTLLGLAHPPAIALAERLVKAAPPGLAHVFYSDSGSTAVEVALKLALQFHQLGGDSRRQRFLALRDAYHGDTLGAVSVGGIDVFHRIFAPITFHTERAEPTHAALKAAFAAHGPTLCALVMEPLVQGAAGMRVHPEGLLRLARELCDRHGVLLIADEVATGFGRTGTMFACEKEGVAPDLLCVAKGLTGGYLPLAATLATEAIYRRFLGTRSEQRHFFHGHTYTGNPLACAAALGSLEVFERDRTLERLPSKIEALEQLLRRHLAGHPSVMDVRQRGLMVGIELGRAPAEPYPPELGMGARVCQAVRRHGVILRPLGDVVVLMPPLCIEPPELELLVTATRRALDEVCAEVRAEESAPSRGPRSHGG